MKIHFFVELPRAPFSGGGIDALEPGERYSVTNISIARESTRERLDLLHRTTCSPITCRVTKLLPTFNLRARCWRCLAGIQL